MEKQQESKDVSKSWFSMYTEDDIVKFVDGSDVEKMDPLRLPRPVEIGTAKDMLRRADETVEAWFSRTRKNENFCYLWDKLTVMPIEKMVLVMDSICYGRNLTFHNGYPVAHLDFVTKTISKQHTEFEHRWVDGMSMYPMCNLKLNMHFEDMIMMRPLALKEIWDDDDGYPLDESELEGPSAKLVEYFSACRTSDYTPFQEKSSRAFKSVNATIKEFYDRSVPKPSGRVLIAGGGQGADMYYINLDGASNIVFVEPQVDSIAIARSTVPASLKVPIEWVNGGIDMDFIGKNVGTFDYIITTNSIHWIVAGLSAEEDVDYSISLKRFYSLLDENGIMVGVMPSIHGLVSTPLKVSSTYSGVISINDDGVVPLCDAMFGGQRFKREPLFPASALYSCSNRTFLYHMSRYHHGDKDLARLYECFVSFSKPAAVDIVFNGKMKSITDHFSVARIRGSKGFPVIPLGEWSHALPIDHDAKGKHITHGDFFSMRYQGPYLMSQKMDGKSAHVIVEDKVAYVQVDDRRVCVQEYCDFPDMVVQVEVVADGEKMCCYLIELHQYNRKYPRNWYHQFFFSLPPFIYVKDYYDWNQLREVDITGWEGLVLINPTSPIKSGLSMFSYFLKTSNTIDLSFGGKIYEVDVDPFKIVRERPDKTHSNGFARILSVKYAMSDVVFFYLMEDRYQGDKTVSHWDGLGEMPLSALVAYPYSISDDPAVNSIRNRVMWNAWHGEGDWSQVDLDESLIYKHSGLSFKKAVHYAAYSFISGETVDTDSLLYRMDIDDDLEGDVEIL
jgi:hypothetical protein